MAFIGNEFYVANTDSVMHFPYEEGATKITAHGTKIADLPAGPINLHWVKNIIASPDGKHLYVGVGSNSNLVASGLRNPVGLAFQPDSDALWTTVNERDELGSDLVPDYMTAVKEGGFYGWPYSYYGQHLDPWAKPAAARSRRPSHRAGLRARTAYNIARARLL